MLPVAIVSIGVIVVLALVVIGSMAIENWHQIKVRVRPPSTRTQLGSAAATLASAAVRPGLGPRREPLPEPPGHAGTTGDAGPARDPRVAEHLEHGSPSEVLHVLDGRVVADQLVAALFAAYAASRGSESGRAAAWVCAIDRPPGVSGAEFEPGADLRGKPAAVARLLACRVDGRCWITLRPSVDIARGLVRRAPSSATLVGLTALWSATRAAMTRLADEDLPLVVQAITALEPQWRGTTAAPGVLDLLVACTEAQEAGVGLRLQVTKAPFGPPTTAAGTAAPAADHDSTPSSTSPVGQTV